MREGARFGRWRAVAAAALACLSAEACARRESGNAAAAHAPAAAAPRAGPGSMAPNLTVAGGSVLLSWLEPATPKAKPGSGDYRLLFSRLEGGSWSEPETVASGDEFFANWADFPSLAASPDGWLLAHWAAKSGSGTYAYDVQLARSADQGASWTRLGTAHSDGTQSEHGFVSLIPEEKQVRAFWLDGRKMTGGGESHESEGDMSLYTALIGEKVGPGELLDPRACECCQTSAAMTAKGPVVVYRDRSEKEVRDISIVRRVDGQWTAPAPVHRDGWTVEGCPVNGPSAAAAGERLAVAWYTSARLSSPQGPRVLLAFSDDSGATFAPPVEIDGSGPLGRVDVVLDENGDALVAWVASEGEKAAIRLRRVARDGRAGEARTVTTTTPARSSGFPRLERSGGTLAVAWVESGETMRVRAATLATSDVPAATLAAPGPESAGKGRTVRPWDGKPGSSAPDYAAVSLDGKEVSLADLRGEPVLVNLWATWCGPCRREMPELAALSRRHAANGLRVVGISVDEAASAGKVRRFVRDRKIPYTILCDGEDRASGVFGVPALPGTFLFDREGVLVWSRVGVIEPGDPDLKAALKKALRTS